MNRTHTAQHKYGANPFSRLGRAVRHQWREQQAIQERLVELNRPWERR